VHSASASAFDPSMSESTFRMSALLWWGESTDPMESEPEAEGEAEEGGKAIVCAVAGWPRRLTSSLIHPVVDEKEAIAAAAVDRGGDSVGVAGFITPSSPPTPDTAHEEVEGVEVEVVEVEEEVKV
jgi:hypothetical protein